MQELFLKPRIFLKEDGTQVPPSFRSMVCPGSASVTATAAVAATAIIATAAPIATPAAAAAAQQNDNQDDPQAAPAAKATAVIAPHKKYLLVEKWKPGTGGGASRCPARSHSILCRAGGGVQREGHFFIPAQKHRYRAGSKGRAGQSGPHGCPAPRYVRDPAP